MNLRGCLFVNGHKPLPYSFLLYETPGCNLRSRAFTLFQYSL